MLVSPAESAFLGTQHATPVVLWGCIILLSLVNLTTYVNSYFKCVCGGGGVGWFFPGGLTEPSIQFSKRLLNVSYLKIIVLGGRRRERERLLFVYSVKKMRHEQNSVTFEMLTPR